jgi:peroxidase
MNWTTTVLTGGSLCSRLRTVAIAGAMYVSLLGAAEAMAENRTISGQDNNVDQSTWGSAFTLEMRMAPVAYSDGISAPSGDDRPNARMISNVVVSQPISMPDQSNMTDWVWQWGQFLDHDITLTEFIEPIEDFSIIVPTGDEMFDPDGDGDRTMGLFRSRYGLETGTDIDNPRQQINQITAFIDGSNVYGSDDVRASWLRTGIGGRMKMSEGDMLPFNDGTQVNAGPGGLPSTAQDLFTAGDIRSNEQSGLTAVHTLFLREHNRLADEIAGDNPDWTDEQIYQRARKTVGALIQVISYQEFLPTILGPMAPDPGDARYDPNVNPTIANVFANACYRIGHTMLSSRIMRMDNNGDDIPEGPLALRDAFFNPSHVLDQGIESILMGLAKQRMQTIDNMIVDDVRNFLFGEPGEGGLDLASLNIQRGRDHGLPDYNTVREAFGLERKTSFDQINPDPAVFERLDEAYGGDIDKIDTWVGGLAEVHLPGAKVGELVATVLADQFTRLRDGDRLWYAGDDEFSAEDIEELESTTLADVIRRNTNLTLFPENAFRMVSSDDVPPSDGVALCGLLQIFNLLGLSLGLVTLRRRW